MLLPVKVVEVLNHIEYIQRTCQALIPTAHPNLADRLQYLITHELSERKTAAERLATRVDTYEQASVAAFDTWKQLYSELTELVVRIQYFRTQEMPAYLASSAYDAYLSNLLEAIHAEVGLPAIKPVASLYQGMWFAVARWLPTYPLYLLPSSIVADPSELPLIFHELGHVLFSLWGSDFVQPCQDVIAKTIQRKYQETTTESDPRRRQDQQVSLLDWQRLMIYGLEELVCDIVGALIGGHAFVISLSVGLSYTTASPFDHSSLQYPPLDCRMRVGRIVCQHLGLQTDVVDTLAANWSHVTAMHLPERWYQWVYDDQYLGDLVTTIKNYLASKGVTIYSDDCGGIRQQLDRGLTAMLQSPPEYQQWRTQQSHHFYEIYAASKSSS